MENIHGAICIKIFVEILNIISKPFLQRSGTRAHVNVLCKLDISKSKRLRKAASSVLWNQLALCECGWPRQKTFLDGENTRNPIKLRMEHSSRAELADTRYVDNRCVDTYLAVRCGLVSVCRIMALKLVMASLVAIVLQSSGKTFFSSIEYLLSIIISIYCKNIHNTSAYPFTRHLKIIIEFYILEYFITILMP